MRLADDVPPCRRALLLAAAALASEALAQPAPEEVLVLGRWDNPLGVSSSASVGLVGREELDIRPLLRTGEILEVVPGLIATQHSGTGKSNQMFLRGFNLDHGTDFATFVDGMPVNLPTHGHGQGYTDVNFVIPELVERLEYRKGAYYPATGDFSSAGAAYLSTFRRLPEGMLKAGLGEDGYFRVLAADGVSAGGGEVLYALQTHRYDGPWQDVSEDLERHNALLRYSGGSAGDWDVTLMGYDAEWRAADQIPRRAVESGLVGRLGSLDAALGGETSRYSLSGGWHGPLAGGTARLTAYAIDYELDLFSNFTYFLDDPVAGDQFEQVDDRLVTGGAFELVYGDEARTVHGVGVSVRRDDIDRVGLFRTVARERVGTIRDDAVEELSLAVHYSAETRWTPRLRTLLGLRADRYDFDVKSAIAANSGRTHDVGIAPKASVIYSPGDRLELYASAGKGFHSNDARGTTISVDPVTGEPAERVTPIVDSRACELGMRAFVDRKLNVSAALWYLELDSELLFIGDAGTTEASRASRRYGVEVPLYYRVNDTLAFDLEIALSNSSFKDDGPEGDHIPGAIDRVLAAGVSLRNPNGLYATARVRHFGPRPLTEDGRVESEASTVVNLSLGFRRARADVRLDVLNVFDSDDDDITYFYASRLPGEPDDGVEDLHFHPIEPRTARLHVTWSF